MVGANLLLKSPLRSKRLLLKKGEEGNIGPALAPRFLPEHPIPLLLLIVREFRPQEDSDYPASLKEYQRYPSRIFDFM
jgi:hypothetical protein